MKVSVDKNGCIGCGNCASVCPEVFEMKDGKSRVKQKQTDKPCAKDAAQQCPVHVISVN